ncbi:MAG: GTP-binding protein [Spirochaetaceae bacterium]|jgi:small GTP-binding protein|nr:GTP-binding protein [Spirochaetaceae bacterium]
MEYPFIIGTAGHIDHGKTALVRALTGVDCDRLEEEKRRGITIELGFAPLNLADGRTVSIVDVPGHERFIRQMAAGAAGMDAGMLVISANEGVMPQTREHLDILSILGVRFGLVALTKKDLADNETLARLMNNPQAMEALMSIEGFRNLNQDIETIINKSGFVKKAKQEANEKEVSAQDKRELTVAEKEFKNKRKQIQEKLIKFATRIPVFMYLTDFREISLTDVITKPFFYLNLKARPAVMLRPGMV